jgi:hypothetical protein
MECLCIRVRPCNADAQSASLRENQLSRHLRVSPARPPHFASPLLEGRAPHARKGGITLNRMSPLFGRPRQSVAEGDMPRLAPDPYSRTRRPRPRENHPSRYLRTFSRESTELGGKPRPGGAPPAPYNPNKKGDPKIPLFCSAPRPSRRCTSASRRAPRHRHHHLLQANWPELA